MDLSSAVCSSVSVASSEAAPFIMLSAFSVSAVAERFSPPNGLTDSSACPPAASAAAVRSNARESAFLTSAFFRREFAVLVLTTRLTTVEDGIVAAVTVFASCGTSTVFPSVSVWFSG